MSDIQIVLEPYKPFYCPGEVVTGYVIVELSKAKKINKVCLKAHGRAHVNFWRRHGETNNAYSAEHVYLKTHLTLWDKNNARGEQELPPGRTQYPFSVTIPYDALPSVEATHGGIQYTLKAELDIPWALDKHCETRFAVGASIDTTCAPMYTQPQTACIKKTGIFSSSSSIHAIVSFFNSSINDNLSRYLYPVSLGQVVKSFQFIAMLRTILRRIFLE